MRINFIENIIFNALPISITQNIKECRDPDDDKYLSVAVSAKGDCIISGDQDLLILHPYKKIPILNAADFIALF